MALEQSAKSLRGLFIVCTLSRCVPVKKVGFNAHGERQRTEEQIPHIADYYQELRSTGLITSETPCHLENISVNFRKIIYPRA